MWAFIVGISILWTLMTLTALVFKWDIQVLNDLPKNNQTDPGPCTPVVAFFFIFEFMVGIYLYPNVHYINQWNLQWHIYFWSHMVYYLAATVLTASYYMKIKVYLHENKGLPT